ncbi:MAG TPA: ABC-type transport auxiliary lipoprotein family protein [Geminicoccaceae bacterium]|nr:ABC-type transport auxiliary lipoprotein family protein [Geminicoccaceae bacterium]
MSLDRRTLLLLTAGLAGCTPLDLVGGGRTAPTLYGLSPKSTFPDDLPDPRSLVSIESMSATAGLNTTRIALRPSPFELQYYAGALWIDVVPVMIRTLLIESFENSGKIDAIGDTSGIQADYALLGFVREFQAEYQDIDQPPEVNVRLQVRLLRLPRRESVGAQGWQSRVRATGTAVAAVVDAFDEALGTVMKNAVSWTATTLAELERRRA